MNSYPFSALTNEVRETLKHLNKSECEEAISILSERLSSVNIYSDYELIELIDLPLSIRPFNGLAAEGLKTIGDVLHFGLDNIWKLRYIGPKSEKEIKELFDKILLKKDELAGLSKEDLNRMLK